MVFDFLWNIILPAMAGRYKFLRIAVWAVLVIAAGILFHIG